MIGEISSHKEDRILLDKGRFQVNRVNGAPQIIQPSYNMRITKLRRVIDSDNIKNSQTENFDVDKDDYTSLTKEGQERESLTHTLEVPRFTKIRKTQKIPKPRPQYVNFSEQGANFSDESKLTFITPTPSDRLGGSPVQILSAQQKQKKNDFVADEGLSALPRPAPIHEQRNSFLIAQLQKLAADKNSRLDDNDRALLSSDLKAVERLPTGAEGLINETDLEVLNHAGGYGRLRQKYNYINIID